MSEKFDHVFAPIPTALRANGLFRDLCSSTLGGVAVIAILPFLIMFAAQDVGSFRYSQRQLAYLCGVSVAAIAKARKYLSASIAETTVQDYYRNGTPHLRWTLKEDFRAMCVEARKTKKYFYF